MKLATKFIPTRESFQKAADAGCRCAEFWLDWSWLDRWEDVVAEALRWPLDYALHCPNKRPPDQRGLEQAASLYRALNCSAMVIHQPMWDVFGESLLEIDSSIRLAVENHRLKPSSVELWAESHRWLTLDVEHFWKFTWSDGDLDLVAQKLKKFLKRHGPKVAHVHLPGYLPGQPEHRPMYCSRDFVFAVLSALLAADYQGMVVSETREDFQNVPELRMDQLLFDVWADQALPKADRQAATRPV